MQVVIVLLFAIISLLLPQNALAQDGTIRVNPAYVDVELEHGQEKVEFEIEYTNNSTEAIELEIFAVDFRQTDERGVIGFLGSASENYDFGLSSFLSFEANILQLEPRESKKLLVSVADRLDLSPGGHYASVVARLVSEEEGGEGNTNIAPAASSLVYFIKKGGEQYNLSIREVNWPGSPLVFDIPSAVTMIFQNEGNVHMTPFGTVTIKDVFGREVYRGAINNSSFKVLPSSRRIIPGYMTNIEPLVPVSIMNMEIRGSDFGKNITFIYSESFIYINPWLVGGLAMMIGLFVLRRRKRREK